MGCYFETISHQDDLNVSMWFTLFAGLVKSNDLPIISEPEVMQISQFTVENIVIYTNGKASTIFRGQD